MNQKIDAGTAEILGAFIGDGWLEKSMGSLYITGNPTEDKEYYDLFLGPLFCKIFSKVEPKKFSYWGVYGISCHKRQVLQRCLALGFQSGTKSLTVQIPQEIINSNEPEVIKAILRGIFDADGSFWCEKSRSKYSVEWKRTYHQHPEFQIGSCSKKLLEQIKKLLDEFNIESKVVLRARAGRRNNRNVSNFYGLRIRKKSHIEKWFAIIGSNNPRNQTRYQVWKKYGFLPPRTSISQRREMLLGNLDPKNLY